VSFIFVSFSLFLVLNSLGNIPLFLGMLAKFDVKRQRKIIFRELVIALGILITFSFFGETVLRLLGISQPIIGLAGGALLFIISLGMIFPKESNAELVIREPFIVPLAMPIVSGPGAITAVMVYSEQLHNNLYMLAAILLAWIASLILLLASSNIKYLLGEKGLDACERVGGMLICLISVQMFSSGAIKLIKDNIF